MSHTHQCELLPQIQDHQDPPTVINYSSQFQAHAQICLDCIRSQLTLKFIKQLYIPILAWQTHVDHWAVVFLLPYMFILHFSSKLPQTQMEWAQLLESQQRYHDAELQKWREIIKSSVLLLDQVYTVVCLHTLWSDFTERDYSSTHVCLHTDEGFLTEPTERCGTARLQRRLGREEESILLTVTLQATRARCAM